MGRKSKKPAVPKKKVTISLTAEEIYRLDLLAAHLTLERGRTIDRSDVISEAIRPHLRTVVVSIRSGTIAEDEAAA